MENDTREDLVLSTIKEIRALTDPYRQRLMKALERMGRPATAKEVAQSLGESPSKEHYHMGVLMEHGIVEQHHTESIHGITAKYLKVTDRRIKINSEDGKGEEMFEAVNFFFEQGRTAYIEAMNKVKNAVDKERFEDFEGHMTQTYIYLTEEEAEALYKRTEAYARGPKPDGKRYAFFSAIIPSGDE